MTLGPVQIRQPEAHRSGEGQGQIHIRVNIERPLQRGERLFQAALPRQQIAKAAPALGFLGRLGGDLLQEVDGLVRSSVRLQSLGHQQAHQGVVLAAHKGGDRQADGAVAVSPRDGHDDGFEILVESVARVGHGGSTGSVRTSPTSQTPSLPERNFMQSAGYLGRQPN